MINWHLKQTNITNMYSSIVTSYKGLIHNMAMQMLH